MTLIPVRSGSLDALIRLRLRRTARRLAQGAHDPVSRQVDLEIVVAEAAGVAQHDVGGSTEAFVDRACACEPCLGGRIAPRLVRHPAQGKTRVPDRTILDRQAD